MSEDDRKVVHCPHCFMVQFVNKNPSPLCRRCRKPLKEEISPEDLPPDSDSLTTLSPILHFAQLIATNVQYIRHTKHLSQKVLAERIESSRTYIAKCESGKMLPSIGVIERIAAALGVSLITLIPKPTSRQMQDLYSDPLTSAMIPFIHDLNDQQMKSLLREARRLIAKGRKA